MTQGAGQDCLGIYIKSIVRGGPAERVRPFKPKHETWGVNLTLTHPLLSPLSLQNGRLTSGDQLLSVDGKSLVGLSQER